MSIINRVSVYMMAAVYRIWLLDRLHFNIEATLDSTNSD